MPRAGALFGLVRRLPCLQYASDLAQLAAGIRHAYEHKEGIAALVNERVPKPAPPIRGEHWQHQVLAGPSVPLLSLPQRCGQGRTEPRPLERNHLISQCYRQRVAVRFEGCKPAPADHRLPEEPNRRSRFEVRYVVARTGSASFENIQGLGHALQLSANRAKNLS